MGIDSNFEWWQFLSFFFFSGFRHHLGSRRWFWISLFHFFMSNTPSNINPTLSISLLHEKSSSTWFPVFPPVSFLALVHLPFFLARALLPHYIDMSEPCQIFSAIFFVTDSTFTYPVTCSFLVLSCSVIPQIHISTMATMPPSEKQLQPVLLPLVILGFKVHTRGGTLAGSH